MSPSPKPSPSSKRPQPPTRQSTNTLSEAFSILSLSSPSSSSLLEESGGISPSSQVKSVSTPTPPSPGYAQPTFSSSVSAGMVVGAGSGNGMPSGGASIASGPGLGSPVKSMIRKVSGLPPHTPPRPSSSSPSSTSLPLPTQSPSASPSSLTRKTSTKQSPSLRKQASTSSLKGLSLNLGNKNNSNQLKKPASPSPLPSPSPSPSPTTKKSFGKQQLEKEKNQMNKKERTEISVSDEGEKGAGLSGTSQAQKSDKERADDLIIEGKAAGSASSINSINDINQISPPRNQHSQERPEEEDDSDDTMAINLLRSISRASNYRSRPGREEPKSKSAADSISNYNGREPSASPARNDSGGRRNSPTKGLDEGGVVRGVEETSTKSSRERRDRIPSDGSTKSGESSTPTASPSNRDRYSNRQSKNTPARSVRSPSTRSKRDDDQNHGQDEDEDDTSSTPRHRGSSSPSSRGQILMKPMTFGESTEERAGGESTSGMVGNEIGTDDGNRRIEGVDLNGIALGREQEYGYAKQAGGEGGRGAEEGGITRPTQSRTLSIAMEEEGISNTNQRDYMQHSWERQESARDGRSDIPISLTKPTIVRASSFVRGDDSAGLPQERVGEGSGSMMIDQKKTYGEEEETWRRDTERERIREDSGGSGGSNRRRSGLPSEFRQDLIQDAVDRETPSRRSVIHGRYATDSASPQETPSRLASVHNRDSPSRTGGEDLHRTASMRSGITPSLGGHTKRMSLLIGGVGDGGGVGNGYDHSLPSRSMSVMGRNEDWESGSLRGRHSSLGMNLTSDLDRAESKRRRAALLSNGIGAGSGSGNGLSRLTPNRPGTSLRMRDPMSEPKQPPGHFSSASSSSMISLKGGHLTEAPNSAPVHSSRLHRQSLSTLPERIGLPNQQDSPLARYHRPPSRAATSMAGSAIMGGGSGGPLSRYGGGDGASRFGDDDTSSTIIRSTGSREFPLQGTPSRIYMTRLMAALRNASSSASRDMMEACLDLHQSIPAHLDTNTVLRHKTQTATSNADRISGHLKQALDLVAQMTVECEISAPEEAQEIALAYADRLKSVLEGAARESDLQIGGMTELFTSMTGMVTELGQEGLRHDFSQSRADSSTSSLHGSTSLHALGGRAERSPGLLSNGSLYRPTRASVDLRRENTVAGPPIASRVIRPGSALLFRNQHNTLPLDEATSSSGSSGTRTARISHRPTESMYLATTNTSLSGPQPASEERKRHSLFSKLQTSPLRHTTMLPAETGQLPNGSPPSSSLSRNGLRLRSRESSFTSTGTSRANFMPTATARATTTTAVSQVNASPNEGLSTNAGAFGANDEENTTARSNGMGHRKISSSGAGGYFDDVGRGSSLEGYQTTERAQLGSGMMPSAGGAFKKLSGVRGPRDMGEK